MSKSLPSELVLALSCSVSVASTRSRLSQVRNKKKESSRARYAGRARGERRKSMGRRKRRRRSRESEKQEQEGKEELGGGEEEGPKLSLGSLPSGLVLARSCPFTTFSFFRDFFSFSSPTAVLSTLSSKVQPPPCFSSSACTPTALYACKQPSRVRLKKEEKKEKRRTMMGREGGGRNREDKTNDMRIMQSVPYRVTENEARE